jgi:propionyl-CoA carboxylase beta chain
LGGGKDRIAKQHQKKKLTARERVDYLMDEGSFEEIGVLVTHRTTDFGMAKSCITVMVCYRIRNY